LNPYRDNTFCVERLMKEYRTHGKPILALDFDDTVFDYHKQGYDPRDVLQRVREAQYRGFYIMLFTAAPPESYSGQVSYLADHGITVDSINSNPVWLPFGKNGKPYYNILLDDRAGLGQSVGILTEVLRLIAQAKGESTDV
jgi:hypothetical protein